MVTTAMQDGKPCWPFVNENHPIGGGRPQALARKRLRTYRAPRASSRQGSHRAHLPAQRKQPLRLSGACPRGLGRRSRPGRSRLCQPRARHRRLRGRREAPPAGRRTPQRRDRLGLQRHAVGAPAARALPRDPQEGRAAGRRRRPVRRRRAGDVRRHHAGSRRHGAVALQPRRGRDVDRGRALARHVRRRADARRVRQDRARAADRRADLRPPADGLRARRPDAERAAQRREEPRPSAPRDGRGRRRGAARGRARRPITRPAPAPSTGPRTPTSSWSRRWACTSRARSS